MTMTMLLGFSVIGGLLAGYSVARLAPLWALFLLWALTIFGAILFYGYMHVAVELDPFAAVAILFGALVPIAVCSVVAGAIGLVVRRVVAKKTQP